MLPGPHLKMMIDILEKIIAKNKNDINEIDEDARLC